MPGVLQLLRHALMHSEYCESDFLPGSFVEQDQYRQDLQSAQQHGKGQQDLREPTVPCIAGIRADRFKRRADIGNAGDSCGEIAEESVLYFISSCVRHNAHHLTVHRIKGQQEQYCQQNKEIQGNESENIVDGLSFQCFTLKLGFGNIAGVDQLSDIDIGITSLDTLIPPAVEPAIAPQNITRISVVVASIGHTW